MREQFSLLLVSGLFVLGLLSCEEKKESQEQWTKEHLKTVLDSIGLSKVIASFSEDNCFSVLVFDSEERKIARKLTYRKGYPIFIDTLVYKKNGELKSQRFNTTYLIKDSTVLSINYVKIIHPSSNWQGQTPWQQPYISNYKRTDKKIFETKK